MNKNQSQPSCLPVSDENSIQSAFIVQWNLRASRVQRAALPSALFVFCLVPPFKQRLLLLQAELDAIASVVAQIDSMFSAQLKDSSSLLSVRACVAPAVLFCQSVCMFLLVAVALLCL